MKLPGIMINFNVMDAIVLQLHYSDKSLAFVMPEWKCCYWFKPIFTHRKIVKVELPGVMDLFVDKNGNPMGDFPWKHYLCVTKNLQKKFDGILV